MEEQGEATMDDSPPDAVPEGDMGGDMGGDPNDWWLWIMLSFFIFACIVVFIIIIFEDPEVRAASRQHARRLNDWYNERYSQEQEEMMMISQHRQQEPNPPLYQTIVPPTYQYQKPPTPLDPPPKYEEWPEAGTPGSGPASEPGGGADTAQENGSGAEPASGSHDRASDPLAVPSDGQPEYTRRGKVKKSRNSPLLKHIRSLEGQKLLRSGHNIFIRKSDTNGTQADQDIDAQPGESLVYEFRAHPINPFEIQ